ncbi:MAG TPA: methyl-accepting chemotaxis protein [Stellaceae bacterium]|nr:methyl-accepting chemotaxis protein [Stellaceae bacterium]
MRKNRLHELHRAFRRIVARALDRDWQDWSPPKALAALSPIRARIGYGLKIAGGAISGVSRFASAALRQRMQESAEWRRHSRLRQSMLAIAAGDLDATIPECRGTAGEMAAALAALRDLVRAAQAKERQAAEEGARLAEAHHRVLLDLAEDVERSIAEAAQGMAGSANGMRADAEAAIGSAGLVRGQADTVIAASTEAVANVGCVAAATEELARSTAEIGDRIGQSSAITAEAVRAAGSTNATVGGLLEAAEKIGTVVKLISDIARQTNLLALNATIEAARAGEAGKGFAVVAGEVKLLAGQTAKATEEIGKQVGAMQAATREAAAAIENIGRTIGRVDEVTAAMAAAVEKQAGTTQRMAGSVGAATADAEAVAAAALESARKAEEAEAAIRRVQEGGAALVAQSNALRAELLHFMDRVRAR